MNKNFDETIHSLVEEINDLMAEIYRDNEDVLNGSGYQK